jgi:hypothetical protein
MRQEVPAIPRPRHEFKLVPLNDPKELETQLNELGAMGFALASQTPLTFPGTSGLLNPDEQFLLLARPVGLDIVAPGLLG